MSPGASETGAAVLSPAGWGSAGPQLGAAWWALCLLAWVFPSLEGGAPASVRTGYADRSGSRFLTHLLKSRAGRRTVWGKVGSVRSLTTPPPTTEHGGDSAVRPAAGSARGASAVRSGLAWAGETPSVAALGWLRARVLPGCEALPRGGSTVTPGQQRGHQGSKKSVCF